MLLALLTVTGCGEPEPKDTAVEVEDTETLDTEDTIDTGSNDPNTDETDTSDSDVEDTQDTEDATDTNQPEPNPEYIGGYNTNLCTPEPTSTGFGIGQVSHDFELMDQHGEMVSLSDFCANTVLIVSSATWCGACRSEAPYLEAFYQQHKDSDFIVITLLAENDYGQTASQSDLQQWANDYGLSHPVLADVNFDVTAGYMFANSSFNGSIALPNMQLLSGGMVVETSNDYLSDSQILSYIQAGN